MNSCFSIIPWEKTADATHPGLVIRNRVYFNGGLSKSSEVAFSHHHAESGRGIGKVLEQSSLVQTLFY
jgi:hypothetical protein